MESIKKQISNELKKIEEMIKNGENNRKIEIERKKLDKMLEEYLKDI